MKEFKTIDQLESYLEKKLIQALTLTKNEIFDIVSRNVLAYYNEPVFNNDDPTEPVMYQRTGMLLSSLTNGDIVIKSNEYSFTVGWDDDYMTFRYKNTTGLSVLMSMNSERHGWTIYGTHKYWDESLETINSLYGGVEGLFKRNCVKVGIQIS